VGMQVKHHLSSTTVHIDEKTVTGISDAKVSGQLLGHISDMTQYGVPVRDVVQRWNMLPRNYKDMNRRRWIRVPEGNHHFILINDVRRDLAVNYFAEYAAGHLNTLRSSANQYQALYTDTDLVVFSPQAQGPLWRAGKQ
jgi:hypothetical protein